MEEAGTAQDKIRQFRAEMKHGLTPEKYFRETTCINCWHLKPYETAAMWSVYTQRGYGVAIQSTFQRLIDSFASTTKEVFK